MASQLGACHSQIDRACELGLLPDPNVGCRRWSAGLVEDIRGRWREILAGIEAAREPGAGRCAALLAGRTGLDVDCADIEELPSAGSLRSLATTRTGRSTGWPPWRSWPPTLRRPACWRASWPSGRP